MREKHVLVFLLKSFYLVDCLKESQEPPLRAIILTLIYKGGQTTNNPHTLEGNQQLAKEEPKRTLEKTG